MSEQVVTPRTRAPIVTRKCLTCQKSFSFPDYKNRNGDKKYCGRACFLNKPLRPLEERLWAQVTKSDNCWVWTGNRNDFGYGLIQRGRRGEGNDRTHRVSWTIHNGNIPTHMCVLHECDNPPCVRPDHLFLGTRLDNNRDMMQKGRQRPGLDRCVRGSAHPNAKLIERAVANARQRCAQGASVKEMAREYGVAETTLHNAITGKTWAHVL